MSNDTVSIENGRFNFSGNLLYTTGVKIVFIHNKKTSFSRPVFIAAGLQQMVFNTDSSLYQLPYQSGNEIHDEYQQKFWPQRLPFVKDYYNWVDDFYKIDARYKVEMPPLVKDSLFAVRDVIYNRLDSMLYTYIQQRPNSIVGLYYLYEHLKLCGYDNWNEQSYQLLHDSVKAMPMGRVVARLIDSMKLTAVGQPFPAVKILADGKLQAFSPDLLTARYTLIDFWYARCAPCLSGFETLKPIYNRMKAKGFSIIGITVDRKNDEIKWRQIVKQKRLAWPQWWDEGGKAAGSIGITGYPQNYLINQQGIIIRQNISPAALQQFLQKNL